jgi:hypothetical protein
MKNISWYLKQLLPLRYETEYTDSQGVDWLVQWKMWFGKVFDIREWILSTGYESLAREYVTGRLTEWNGYKLPPLHTEHYINGDEPILNKETGEYELECWELPINIVRIWPQDIDRVTPTNWHFIVDILGVHMGFSRVEFPVIDTVDDQKPLIVKLYRAKFEEEE